MKAKANPFLSDPEHEQIDAAVRAAEANTSGEIVCMIQSASYHYPLANVMGGTALALPSALALMPVVGGWLWAGTQNVWVFLSLFSLLFALFYLLVRQWPWLKRRFISRREIDEEVEEAAVTSFFRNGLYRTREATGVLIYISVFERRVWVLADHGINAKIEKDQWRGLVKTITDGIQNHRPAAAICEAVHDAGDLLATHFPKRADDTDELRNVIV